jgi:hypothetical protein
VPENARGSDPQTDPATDVTVAQRTALRQGETRRKAPLDHLPKRTPAEVSLQASSLAHLGWGQCEDRTARTAPGRAAFEQRFLDQADGDPVRAASLRAAYYKDLARQSVAARRRNREARENGAA